MDKNLSDVPGNIEDIIFNKIKDTFPDINITCKRDIGKQDWYPIYYIYIDNINTHLHFSMSLICDIIFNTGYTWIEAIDSIMPMYIQGINHIIELQNKKQ